MTTNAYPAARKPLVSIVIPTYRRAPEVSRALASIQEPNVAVDDLEIIIVDNASGDGIQEVAERYRHKFPNLHLHIWDSNVGAIENWRRGIMLAQGPWLKILWSDDQLEPRAIELLLETAIRNRVRVVTCRATVDYPDGKTVERYLDRATVLTPDVVMSELLHLPAGLPSSPGAALVRTVDARQALEARLPAICTERAIGPDLLISYWGLFNNGRGVHRPETLVRFSAGIDSITVQTSRAVLSSCYVAAMNILAEKTPRSITRTTLRRMRSRAALDSLLGGDQEALISPRRLSVRASFYDAWQISKYWFAKILVGRREI